jgi:acetolactate synthase I/II/III large subunit
MIAERAQTALPKGRMTGGRALAEVLRLAGIGPMFGMAGFQLLPFYEAVRALELKHFLINDERTGAFASDAYARVSGRPGACDATLGPGVTNLVTALVESFNAGVPVIAIAGDANRTHAWKNMTQETRQVDILRPAVKDLLRIESVQRVPEFVARAFAIATSGRPGPVVIDVPEDVAHGEHEFVEADFRLDPKTFAIPAHRARPAQEDIEAATRLLARAKRPLILAGGGIHLSRAYAALARLAEEQSIPVAHTMSGKGSIACTSPLSAGLFGRYSRIANELIAESDCLLVVGCKLGEIATKRYALIPRNVPLIHLEVVAEEIGRTTLPEVALWGDAREGLNDLADSLASGAPERRGERREYVADVAARMNRWRIDAMPRYTSAEIPINMGRLIGDLQTAMPTDGILVADGGFAAHWTGLLYDTKVAGRTYVADRGLASIGYGLPGAIGAQLAAPDVPVVAITGDGGFNMTIGDLETAKRAGTNVIIVVVNNAASGYVKALQHAMYGSGNYQSSDLVEMDYAAIARAMGCGGIRVERPDDLASAYRRAMDDRSKPTVIDVVVTRDPGAMLPAADNRTLVVKAGDRPV